MKDEERVYLVAGLLSGIRCVPAGEHPLVMLPTARMVDRIYAKADPLTADQTVLANVSVSGGYGWVRVEEYAALEALFSELVAFAGQAVQEIGNLGRGMDGRQGLEPIELRWAKRLGAIRAKKAPK